MTINDFVKNFASQFEETEAKRINAQTRFREEIEEWDSLRAMSIIAMVDEVYGLVLKGEDIRNCNTVEDLFNIIQSKN